MMNSKERVCAVIDGKVPDRTPLAFYAIDSDTVAKVLGRETYWRNKAKSTIAFWQGRRDEVVQSWIEDGIELYKKLDIIDITPVGRLASGLVPPKGYEPNPPKKIADDTWEDKEGCIYKYSPVTNDITMVSDPNLCSRDYSVEKLMWDGTINPPDESVFEVVEPVA